MSGASSSDQSIVANANISLNSGKTALQVTTGANLGSTTITVNTFNSDLIAGGVATTFVLTVRPSLSVSGDSNPNTIR
jgi:hypothetical protein